MRKRCQFGDAVIIDDAALHRLDGRGEEFAGAADILAAGGAGEQAIVTDAVEAGGQNMDQEAANGRAELVEFGLWQRWWGNFYLCRLFRPEPLWRVWDCLALAHPREIAVIDAKLFRQAGHRSGPNAVIKLLPREHHRLFGIGGVHHRLRPDVIKGSGASARWLLFTAPAMIELQR